MTGPGHCAEAGEAGKAAVRCQHCERDIEPLPSGYWMDSDGLMVCKKRVRDETFMTHQPMPQVTP
jgi:hypothetical protein